MHENQVDLNVPLKPMSQRAHRALAVQILYAIDRSNDAFDEFDSTNFINRFITNYNIAVELDCFALQLVQNVHKNVDFLESKIDKQSKNWCPERIGCLTKIIIKIAMTEIIYNISPAKIAIDEAIELAKDFCEQDAYKFVNGILDNFFKQHSAQMTQSK